MLSFVGSTVAFAELLFTQHGTASDADGEKDGQQRKIT
jgi:hypothetical protein